MHYYFGGKDQLLVEALQAAGQQFHHRMQHLVQQASSDQALDVFLTQLAERVGQEEEVYRLRYESFALGLHNPAIAPGVRERLAQRREEIGAVMATILEHPQRREDAKPSALDPTILAALLLALFDGLALQKIMDPTFGHSLLAWKRGTGLNRKVICNEHTGFFSSNPPRGVRRWFDRALR